MRCHIRVMIDFASGGACSGLYLAYKWALRAGMADTRVGKTQNRPKPLITLVGGMSLQWKLAYVVAIFRASTIFGFVLNSR